MQRLLIVGAGGHGRSVAEAVLAAGSFQLVGFADDAAPGLKRVAGLPVLGTTAGLARYRQHADASIVAVGNNRPREALYRQAEIAGFDMITVVHPASVVSPQAIIGAGSALMAGCIIGTGAVLGVGAIVNCGAVIDHDCQVEDFGHLAVRTAMAGGAVLGRAAWLQPGAILGYGARVEAGVVAAAAVVNAVATG